MQQRQQALMPQRNMTSPQVNQQTDSGFTIRPVSHVNEVWGTPLSNVFNTDIFINVAAQEIYVSQSGEKGLKEVSLYKFSEKLSNQPAPTMPQSELTEIYAKIDSKIDAKFEELKNIIGGLANESGPDNAVGKVRGKSSANLNEPAPTGSAKQPSGS